MSLNIVYPGTAKVTVCKTVEESAEFYKSRQWKTLRADFVRSESIRLNNRLHCVNCGVHIVNLPKIPDLPEFAKSEILNVDHINPVRLHWDQRLDSKNLQLLCGPCNKEKGNDTTGIRLAIAKERREAELLNERILAEKAAKTDISPSFTVEENNKIIHVREKTHSKSLKTSAQILKEIDSRNNQMDSLVNSVFNKIKEQNPNTTIPDKMKSFIRECGVNYLSVPGIKKRFKSLSDYVEFALQSKINEKTLKPGKYK